MSLDNRQRYYAAHHPQTIAFEIARDVVRQLTDAADGGNGSGAANGNGAARQVARHALFPQALRIVQAYVRERVDLRGCHPCEIGLQTYAERIAALLAAAIRPHDSQGERPPLPRLNRYQPLGSTARVRFKTARPVQATQASHLNYVACDTGSWEQAAAVRLERLAGQGIVECYARNDHLEFTIPYQHYGDGEPRAYEPDFIVRLTNGLHVVLEIKGQSRADTDAKHEAAKRWVRAVNHWRRLGEWRFLVCRDPQTLGHHLTAVHSR